MELMVVDPAGCRIREGGELSARAVLCVSKIVPISATELRF